jgi:hypothetical protein
MSDTPMHYEVNLETGEHILRPYTAAEIAERDQMAAQAEEDRQAREAEAQAKADALLSAQAKLAAMGLTGEEVAAITQQ